MKGFALHCNLPRIGYVKGLSILIILGSLPVPVYNSVDEVICYFN